MAAANVVEILVKSTDETEAGFAGAKAGADETAAAMEEYSAAAAEAAEAEGELTAASAGLAEVQADESAQAYEVAVAYARVAAAQERVGVTADAAAAAEARLSAAQAESAETAGAAGDAQVAAGAKSDEAGGLMAGAGGKIKMAALGVAVGLGLAVKGGADFQTMSERWVTTAGESQRKLGMVQAGVLALSSATNTSVQDLSDGMYVVESAGYHGAQGLLVLKAAAQGAQAEGANVGDVANAVTSILNAYGLKAKDAGAVTNEMLATVGQGKMTFQDLASSVSAVLPIAASAHISFAQVGGAIATMTGQGMSARQASQDLANMIRELLKPSGEASAEMRALGLNANDVSKNLGKVGLTGTVAELSDAILKNTSGGNVLLGYMKEMSPEAQGLARQILAGSISTNDLRTAVKGLNPEQAKLISMFEASATSATGLKQTYDSAMASMVGGSTGLNVALMVGGSHQKTFDENTQKIAGSAKHAGSNIAGWSKIQGEANFQLGSAEKAVKATGDALGLSLLPAVTGILKPLTGLLEMVARNRVAADTLALVAGGLLAGALGGKLAGALGDARKGLGAVFGAFGKLGPVFGKLPGAASSAWSGVSSAFSSGASAIGSGLSSAGSSVASFVSGMAGKLGSAMAATGAWIAEHAAATASFIAENLAQAASATAAFIAENAATLGIGAAIAALVAIIIYLATHWKQVWGDVKKYGEDAWHFLDNDVFRPMQRGIQDVIGFFGRLWRDGEHNLEMLGAGAARVVDDVIDFFTRLRAQILSTIEHLASDLFHAGGHIISMLASGIMSGIGDVTHAIGSIGSEIMAHLPFSPAKKGPLSGSGSPDVSGRKIPLMLAQGMESGTGVVRTAAARMAAAAGGQYGAGGAGAVGAGGGVMRIQLELTGGDTAFMSALANMIRARGGDPRILTRKVVLA